MKNSLHTRKRLVVLFMLILLKTSTFSQIISYFNTGAFNVPGQQPFLETYLTLIGNSFSYKTVGTHYQNSVNISLLILKDSTIVKANKYNLISPAFDDTLKAATFIDNQRYSLPNGIYEIQITISDNYNPKQKPVHLRQKFVMAFHSDQIESSSIEVLESYKKATVISGVTKSGFDLIPYNVNYFPEIQNDLLFYFETYNTDTILGKNTPFVFYYYIEGADNLIKLNSYGAFKKQNASKVNPLLAKLDISKLGSGNYNLVIEIKDGKNIIQHQKKYFFQRLNKAVDIVAMYGFNEKKSIAEYFGSCDNADTLKMFVECLWPISNGIDKERVINQAVKKDKDLMKKFIIDFWQRRAADSVSPLKLWAEYYKNVQQVMVLFKCGKQPGYYTERGRVYLQYGAPSQRSVQNADLNTFPYEIWQYYRLNDRSNGQFFSNRKFVFVNKNIADDCHTLIHSDTRGEIYNDRWRFELTRRNNNGVANPDNTAPVGTQYNQFDEIYSNPR
ncbi:MAG: GWxTD domain-containing protein [Bacteroidetes bacterium]|nr:GWxTD domain-containing protein [Bacteroidota bacterium]